MENKENLGQHFLIDEKVLDNEIKIANLKKEEKVIEIGAGNGILTEHLCKHAGKVLSFEIDESFKEKLDELVEKNKNLEIRYKDATKEKWFGFNKIVANIPYYLSEAIILKAIREKIYDITMIVGQEFKERLEGESKIGYIARLFYKIEVIDKVGNESFLPKPKTDSYLIKLEIKDEMSEIEHIMAQIILGEGKIKNALVKVLVNMGKTKRIAKEIATKLEIDQEIMEKPCFKITFPLIKRIENSLMSRYFVS